MTGSVGSRGSIYADHMNNWKVDAPRFPWQSRLYSEGGDQGERPEENEGEGEGEGESEMRPKPSRRPVEGRRVKLFGVEITVEGNEREEDVSAAAGENEDEEEIMRKSWSMGNLTTCEVAGTKEALVSAGDQGYLSDEGPGQSTRKGRASRGLERKRGVPWSEDEHRTFLIGLEKLGKGDWRGIAKNFVTTRTPTQVASHAQKYFLRQTNPNRKKRRSSLFDVVINDNASASGNATPLSLNENALVIPEENHFQKGVQVEAKFSSSTLEASGSLESYPSLPLVTNCPDFRELCKFNLAAGATGAMKNHVVDVESRNSQTLSLNLNVEGPYWAEGIIPNFSLNLAMCSPELFMISAKEYPQLCPLLPVEAAATPGPQFNDLELRIAPPQPHRLTEYSSSSTAGAIRVV